MEAKVQIAQSEAERGSSCEGLDPFRGRAAEMDQVLEWAARDRVQQELGVEAAQP